MNGFAGLGKAFDQLEKDAAQATSERLENARALQSIGDKIDAIQEWIDSQGREKPEPKAEPPAQYKPELIEPMGFKIGLKSHLFAWRESEGWEYNLELGTSRGGHDLFWQEDPIEGGSFKHDDLPVGKVRKIYARLWHKPPAHEYFHADDYTDFEYDVTVDIEIPPATSGRAKLVFPDKPEMHQADALPIKINDDGTAELSKAAQVELSHSPELQGAPVAESLPELARAIKNRVPLVRVKGDAMRGMSLNLSGEKFDGINEGVTVVEPQHSGAVCPNIYLQDTSAVVAQNFDSQDRNWKFRGNGVCNSLLVSGIRWAEGTGKSPVAFNPPDKNRGVMENCVAQDLFAVYDYKGEATPYDEVMVIFATSEIGWSNSKTAHARNCGTINIMGIDRGDKVQWLARNDDFDAIPLAQIDMEGCFDIGGLGVATFSNGRSGGNTCPENPGLDGKDFSHNPSNPAICIGNTGIGFGESSSDRGVLTIAHITKGYLESSNHLGIAMNQGVVSSTYMDNRGVEMSNSHICGGIDYAAWRNLGFSNHAIAQMPAAFVNYVNGRSLTQGKAKMHSNTAYMHPNIGNGGGRMLKDSEVRKLMFKLPVEFGRADSRMAKSFAVYVPKDTRELVW